jgi:hypothetical protein
MEMVDGGGVTDLSGKKKLQSQHTNTKFKTNKANQK